MHKRILVIYVECTLLRSGIFEVTYIMNEDKIIEVYNKGITEVISLIKVTIQSNQQIRTKSH